MTRSQNLDLKGKILAAMPEIGDKRFERTTIYMCDWSPKGAMGLVINKTANELSFSGLLDQLKIMLDDSHDKAPDMPIMVGGPVETGRGFILHTPDVRMGSATVDVRDGICLTGTVDMVRAIAHHRGPRQSLFALGYSGWSAGQLENELKQNAWLIVDASPELLFHTPPSRRYETALKMAGIDLFRLSGTTGSA